MLLRVSRTTDEREYDWTRISVENGLEEEESSGVSAGLLIPTEEELFLDSVRSIEPPLLIRPHLFRSTCDQKLVV